MFSPHWRGNNTVEPQSTALVHTKPAGCCNLLLYRVSLSQLPRTKILLELLHCRPDAPGGFHEAENIPTLDTTLLLYPVHYTNPSSLLSTCQYALEQRLFSCYHDSSRRSLVQRPGRPQMARHPCRPGRYERSGERAGLAGTSPRIMVAYACELTLQRNFRFISIVGFGCTLIATWEVVLTYVIHTYSLVQ